MSYTIDHVEQARHEGVVLPFGAQLAAGRRLGFEEDEWAPIARPQPPVQELVDLDPPRTLCDHFGPCDCWAVIR